MHRSFRYFAGTPWLRVGSGPQVFERLREPAVLGAVWTRAWSDDAQAAARAFVSRPENNSPGDQPIVLALDPRVASLLAGPFGKELDRNRQIFLALRQELGLTAGFLDQSQVEPALGDRETLHAGERHLDQGMLTGLAVPAGLGPMLSALRPTRRFADRFLPDDFTISLADTKQLDARSFLVMKSWDHPDVQAVGSGIWHWRPNQALKASPAIGRAVVQFQLR